MTRLAELKSGKKARIVHMGVKGPAGQRYREMGMVRGETIEIVRVAPLGDPMEIEVKGYNLSLRKDEAELIIVEVMK